MTDPASRADPVAGAAVEREIEEARRRGFFGPRPAAEQRAHAETFLRLAGAAGVAAASFLDLGSGGGLPGLVAATVWPEAEGALLDSVAKRCAFLRDAVRRLGWDDRIRVLEGRGEVLARRPDLRSSFPIVLARSFASPPVTAEIGGAFLASGGTLIVSEPESDEGRWPDAGLDRLGLEVVDRRRTAGAGIVVLRRVEVVDDAWPRATGVPRKRPLW